MGDEYDNLVFTAYEDQQHENDQGTSSSSSSKVLISADNISNFILLNSFSTDIRRAIFLLEIRLPTQKEFGTSVATAGEEVISLEDGVSVRKDILQCQSLSRRSRKVEK